MKKIKDYIEELNTVDEHVRIEAKQCSDKIDKSVLESICSFNDGTSGVNDGTSGSNDAGSTPNDAGSTPNDAGPNGIDELPKSLKDRIDQLGLRVSKEILADIIIELCKVKPFSCGELAGILDRSEAHIRNRIVPTLLEKGRLKFIYPEMISHPNQKYTAK